MLNLQLALKYSTAIFEIAKEENKLVEYGEELATVRNELFSVPEARSFFQNPNVLPVAKKELITKCFKGELSPIVYNFLLLLIDKRRMGIFEAIEDEYRKLSNREQGILIADVTTARPLTKGQQTKLQKKLETLSGKKIQYFDPETGESYVPYCVETSIGVDRMFLTVLSHAYKNETLENGETRVVLSIPAPLAPVKAAVLPLVKKDGLPELAQKVMDELKYDFNCQYEEKDSIGKRYRRQDAIGTPFCITIDHQSLEDGCVTVRDRDTMAQERVKIEDLRAMIDKKVSLSNLLRNL